MKYKIRAMALIFLMVLSFITGCGKSIESMEKRDETIKIAYLPITHSLPLLEEAEKMEEKDGTKIELVKYGSWPELLDALNTEKVDGASVLIELAMKAKSEGIGLKAVALGHREGNVVIVSNDINNEADLKGKTFAIPHRQSSHNILLNETLAKAGLTISDITVTELAPTEMPSALAAGTIDGYCVAEPFGAMGVSLNAGKVLYTSDELWKDSVCCGLVLTDRFIKNRPEDAKYFVEKYKDAGNNLNQEEALRVSEEYFSQSEEVLEKSLEWISFDNLNFTEDIYNTLVEKVINYDISDNPPTYEEFVKNDF